MTLKIESSTITGTLTLPDKKAESYMKKLVKYYRTKRWNTGDHLRIEIIKN